MAGEKNFENRLKEWLEAEGIYPLGEPVDHMSAPPCGFYEKRWGGSRYVKSGLPDMRITVKGIALEVELKATDGTPSVLQKRNLAQINGSQGFGFILYPEGFEAFKTTATRRRTVLEQQWKPKACSHFTLRERGKIRPIDAPHITDRQIHKTLCNEVLIPLYSPSMIYDNGASQKGKGLHWQFKRIKQQLGWHYRRYGREGAVLLLDLKGFFPNASHALLYQRHRELILNPELQNLADTVIQYSPCPTPGRGMPLGVEPSQQEMVALPSKIDQWIKCQARVHCAGHYMDDYYAFFPTVDEAKLMGHEIVRRFEAAGIRVNKRKCKVIPLTKPFRFCKARFTLTETGKIKVNGSRDGVKRARRKLKLFHKEFKEGKRSFFDIEQYMECQSAYYRNFNDHGRLLRLRRLYHAIFFGGGQCLESSKPGPVSA